MALCRNVPASDLKIGRGFTQMNANFFYPHISVNIRMPKFARAAAPLPAPNMGWIKCITQPIGQGVETNEKE